MIHQIITGLVLLLIIAAVMAFIRSRRGKSAIVWLANSILVNITPKGRATAVADQAFPARYLLCVRGAEYYSINIAGSGPGVIPYGVVPDMTPTTDTDLSYPLPVNILGLNEDTERMIAGLPNNIDDLLTTYGEGKTQPVQGAGPGTWWVVGKAKTATQANGDQVEVIPCFPYAVTNA